jgi:hypothetical protein
MLFEERRQPHNHLVIFFIIIIIITLLGELIVGRWLVGCSSYNPAEEGGQELL